MPVPDLSADAWDTAQPEGLSRAFREMALAQDLSIAGLAILFDWDWADPMERLLREVRERLGVRLVPNHSTGGIDMTVSGVPYGGSVYFEQYVWWQAYGHYRLVDPTQVPANAPRTTVRQLMRRAWLPLIHYDPPEVLNRLPYREPLEAAEAATPGIFTSTPAAAPGETGTFGLHDKPETPDAELGELWGYLDGAAPPGYALDYITVVKRFHLIITVSTAEWTASYHYYWRQTVTFRDPSVALAPGQQTIEVSSGAITEQEFNTWG
jgi:hypothetical protein